MNLNSDFLNNYKQNIQLFSDIINISLYENDTKYVFFDKIKTFVTNLKQDINNISDKSNINSDFIRVTNAIESILDLKLYSEYKNLINYNTVEKYLPDNKNAIHIINNIKKDKILSIDEFDKKIDTIEKEINIFNKYRSFYTIINNISSIISKNSSGDISSISFIEDLESQFKEGYSIVSSNSNNNNTPNEKFSKLIFSSNEEIIDSIVSNQIEYLSESYNYYKTGYQVIDEHLGGIESSTVSVIVGFTNTGKSLFMINILSNILKLNHFKNNEVILYISLEDHAYKSLANRIYSIIGHYNSVNVTKIVRESNNSLKNGSNKQKEIFNILKTMYKDINKSNVDIDIRHFSEQSFSMDDAKKIINEYKTIGKKVVVIMIDYIDNMEPIDKTKRGDDYNAQGAIVKDMRSVAIEYSIPIISITQANKKAEDIRQTMDSSVVGDSLKKIRSCENMIMMRRRNDIEKNISNEYHKLLKNKNSKIKNFDFNNIKLFEFNLYKSKDSAKPNSPYLLFFDNRTLIFHDYLDIYLNEIQDYNEKNKWLEENIKFLNLTNNLNSSYVNDEIDFLN